MKLRCVAGVCVLLAAAGCGQRGPLYLPGDPSEGRVALPGEELPAGGEEEPAGTEDGAAEEPQQTEEPAHPEGQDPAGRDPEDQNPEDDEQ